MTRFVRFKIIGVLALRFSSASCPFHVTNERCGRPSVRFLW